MRTFGVAVVLALIVSVACSERATETDGASGGSGAGGSAGVGGAAGDGGYGGWSHPLGWLQDERLFPIAPESKEFGSCAYSVAARDAFPYFGELEWRSCGTGCERAELIPEYAKYAGGVTVGRDGEGRNLLAVMHRIEIPAGPVLYIRRIIDLGVGNTVAALKTDKSKGNECIIAGVQKAPALLVPGINDSEARASISYARASDGAVTWRMPPVGMGDGPWSSCDPGHLDSGISVFACSIGVFAVEPETHEFAPISDRKGWFTMEAEGNLALWEERLEGGESRLVEWTPEWEAPRPLPAVAGDICGVAIDDEVYAGYLGTVLTEGGYRCGATYDEAKLFVQSREDGEVRIGPSLGSYQYGSPNRVATNGDFVAAAVGIRDPESSKEWQEIVLARASDWQTRRITHPDGGKVGGRTLMIDDRYVYVGDVDSSSTMNLKAIFRFDLEQFDSLGGP